MGQNTAIFETNSLEFEGVVTQPDDMAGPVPGVVICHPGPFGVFQEE